jgi:hypothetical protein
MPNSVRNCGDKRWDGVNLLDLSYAGLEQDKARALR